MSSQSNRDLSGMSTKSTRLVAPSEECLRPKPLELGQYKPPKDPLVTKTYYHGLLPREDVEALLKNEGDFLVRKSEVNNQVRFVISVIHEGKRLHFAICQSSAGYSVCRDETFSTIAQLIVYYWKREKKPISRSGALLLQPVERQEWQLSHDEVIMGKRLGSGAFGDVYAGSIKLQHKNIPVAIKTLRPKDINQRMSKTDRETFVAEARIMKKYVHANIVRLIGIAATEEPIMLVLEFCPGGSLLDLLRCLRGLANESKNYNYVCNEHLRCSFEAAAGLAYLESCNCVHRDIAARNCLIGADRTLKISDFGLRVTQMLPIRWLAPETLQSYEYSMKTDVWSYGVLLWEIYRFGVNPYPGLTNIEVRQKVVLEDYRLVAPPNMPTVPRRIMYMCWHQDPQRRPSFNEIAKWMARVYAQMPKVKAPQ